MISKLLNQLKQIKLKEFSMNFHSCKLCGWKFHIKTYDDEMGVRCTRCGSSAVTQSLGQVINPFIQTEQQLKIYELSSRGAFVRYLQSTHHEITLSEYLDDVPLGSYKDGVMCQDVQCLTFDDESFDICTSLEVFEHVEDDMKGFKEVYRVLKPAGKIIFTVPMNLNDNTVERTKLVNGQREQILPPEYHSDNLRGVGKVFCYRNYGLDIVDRLKSAGFSNCEITRPNPNELFGFGRAVIFGEKLI